MAVAARVSLEEYLNTSYEPDCDYVDGVLEERNVGKRKHSRTQGRLYAWLAARVPRGYEVLPAQRMQISPSRVRVPDLCVVIEEDEEVVHRTPALCVEVFSPEDRWQRVEIRLRDYLAFGVPTVWVIDPYSSRAWMGTQQPEMAEAKDGILRCANLNLELHISDILPEE